MKNKRCVLAFFQMVLFVVGIKVIREDNCFWHLLFSSSQDMLSHRSCLRDPADYSQSLSCDKASLLQLVAV
jgi:hypothetical protein